MAVKKISELTSLGSTPDSNDVFLITDTSGAVSRKVTMANVASFIDSDYIQLRQSSVASGGGLDSALVTQLIDSDYIQLRQSSVASGGGLDSALVTQLIDSAYIQLRDTPQDFAYSSLTGTPSLLDSALVTQSIDSDYIQLRETAQDFAYSSLTGAPNVLDSAYVLTQINALIDGAPGTLNTLNEIAAALNDDDSAYATLVNLIGAKDSDFVKSAADATWIQSNQTPQDFAYSSLTGTPNLLDSALVTQLIDSDYIQLRQSSVGSGGLDSDLVTQLIDSDYVQIRGGRSLFLRKSNDSDYSLTFSQTTPIDQNRHVLGDSALSNDSDGYQIPYDGTYTFTGNYFKNSSLHNNVVEVHILLYKNDVFLDRTVALSVAGTGDNKSADGTFVEKCQKGDIFKFRVFSWSNSGTNNSLQISDGTFRSTCSSNGLVPTNSV